MCVTKKLSKGKCIRTRDLIHHEIDPHQLFNILFEPYGIKINSRRNYVNNNNNECSKLMKNCISWWVHHKFVWKSIYGFYVHRARISKTPLPGKLKLRICVTFVIQCQRNLFFPDLLFFAGFFCCYSFIYSFFLISCSALFFCKYSIILFVKQIYLFIFVFVFGEIFYTMHACVNNLNHNMAPRYNSNSSFQ